MIENTTTNVYEKLEKEVSDLVRHLITYWVFHGTKLGVA